MARLDKKPKLMSRVRRGRFPRRCPRALLVEDNGLLVLLTADFLARLGYEVSTGYDGTEAFALIEKERAYDVAVIDLGLPDLDGREVIKALRKRQPHTPILVATGYAALDVADLSANWDKLVVVEKPWTEADFTKALHELGLDPGPGDR